jgi:peptidyl-dipeptidase Dcp
MPQALLDKVLSAAKFNQGFATTEYLAAAMVDPRWHQITADKAPDAAGVMAFEKQALAADGVDYPPVSPRYHTPYFRHILSSVDGYNAGYYAYVWSEVLDANTRDWFKQHGGPTRANGQQFRDALLSRGGSVDAMELFEKFIGHAPRIEPLLEKRGLKSAAAP